jgi:hypothetical protein
MDTRNIKIIRVLWGDFKDEIPNKPLFNEIVYVYGESNREYLQKLGYETYLVNSNPLGHGDNELNKFYNKLEAIELACSHFTTFLFLDWDVELVKALDDNFFKYIMSKKVLMPTYSYPKEYLKLHNKLLDNNAKRWTNSQITFMKKYGWNLEDQIILPNAGFIFINDMPELGSSLMKIAKENKLLTNIEEFVFYIWSNCTLNQYIQEHEPFCIFGRPTNHMFKVDQIEGFFEKNLHEYINKSIEKNIYFNHN